MKMSGDDIRERMRFVRRAIGEDMDDFVESTKDITDWRSYVKRYPWLCLGAAIAVGYLVVPKRVQILAPDAETLMELAKQKKVVINTTPPQPRSDLLKSIFLGATAAVLRTSVAFAGQRLSQIRTASASQPPRDYTAETVGSEH
jgi:hypothetical protein